MKYSALVRVAFVSGLLLSTPAIVGCAAPSMQSPGSQTDLAVSSGEGGLVDLGMDDPRVPIDSRGGFDLVGADLKDVDLAGADLTGGDLAVADQASADLLSADLATPPDLSTARDLATPPDLTMCTPQTTPCDVLCQNCPAGQKCSASAITGSPICEATGAVGTGQPCGAGGVDDCQPRDVCVIEGSHPPLDLCVPFCRVDADCEPGGSCVYMLAGSPLKICSDPLSHCNPVLAVGASGCASGGCFDVTPAGDTGCHQAGAGGQGAACTTDYDCKSGFSCFGANGCLQICRAGNDLDCPGVLFCNAVTSWATYGVCQ